MPRGLLKIKGDWRRRVFIPHTGSLMAILKYEWLLNSDFKKYQERDE